MFNDRTHNRNTHTFQQDSTQDISLSDHIDELEISLTRIESLVLGRTEITGTKPGDISAQEGANK
eukprot:3191980-Heterocapsa_arctica.AAC.1